LTDAQESCSQLITIPNKDLADLKRNPSICLLVAAILILSFAGQGAAAFKTACEGAGACCCRSDGMPAMTADRVPMAGDCCAAPQAQPCDLADPVSTPADPFLPTANSMAPEISAALTGTTSSADKVDPDGKPPGIPDRPSPHTGPPLYLLIQTMLC
jgi:hypothetical protein